MKSGKGLKSVRIAYCGSLPLHTTTFLKDPRVCMYISHSENEHFIYF